MVIFEKYQWTTYHEKYIRNINNYKTLSRIKLCILHIALKLIHSLFEMIIPFVALGDSDLMGGDCVFGDSVKNNI